MIKAAVSTKGGYVMKSRTIVGISVATLASIGVSAPFRAEAIPAFARKYHTTCARCHSVVPRLNNYGWNFKLRGFHVPGDEEAGMLRAKEDPFLSLRKRRKFATPARAANCSAC